VQSSTLKEAVHSEIGLVNSRFFLWHNNLLLFSEMRFKALRIGRVGVGLGLI